MSDRQTPMPYDIRVNESITQYAIRVMHERDELKQDPRLSDDPATALAAVMGSTGAVVKLYATNGKAIFKFGVEGAPGRVGRFITLDTDECEILTANDINTEGE